MCHMDHLVSHFATVENLLQAALRLLERSGAADLVEALAVVLEKTRYQLSATAGFIQNHQNVGSHVLVCLRRAEVQANSSVARELLSGVVHHWVNKMQEDLAGLAESHSDLRSHIHNLLHCTMLEHDYRQTSASTLAVADGRKELAELDAALNMLEAAGAVVDASLLSRSGYSAVRVNLIQAAVDERSLSVMFRHRSRRSGFPSGYGGFCDFIQRLCL